MIYNKILCEDIDQCKQDPEFAKIINIIDSCDKQGMFDVGRGYCSTTSLVLQLSLIHI